MSALGVELRRNGSWVEMGRERAGGPGGSMSHNAPDGRQVYRFRCLGDHSIIDRSVGGGDFEVGAVRAINPLAGWEEIATLNAENPTYDCWLKTDVSPQPRHIRWHHHD